LQFHPEWDDDTIVALQLAFGADCPLAPNPGRQPQLQAWLLATLDAWWAHAL